MNKHFVSPALKLVATPSGGLEDYFKLAEAEQAAYALFRHIVAYRAIPAHPANEDYRRRMLDIVKGDAEDMLKALTNA